MESVLIVIHLIIVLALVGAVLLQRSEGGGLGIGGGGGGGGGAGGFMSGRGAADVLTRTTAVLAVLFFATSITLTVLSRGSGTGSSIIDDAAGTLAPPTADGTAPATGSDGILDSLQQMQDQSGPQVPQSQ